MKMKIRHIGIVVSDITKSLEFYQSILGFNTLERKTEKGNYIDSLVGIKDVVVEWVKLKSNDNYIVELLQYHSHPQEAKIKRIPSNRIGCSHIALTTEDLNSVCNFFTSHNVDFTKPEVSPDGSVKVIYAYDPDGIIVEIVEERNYG